MTDRLAPPGDTTRVLARSALVVAPHCDDEVIGCGGLIAQLTSAGAQVTVLYVSDSSGGTDPSCFWLPPRWRSPATTRRSSPPSTGL